LLTILALPMSIAISRLVLSGISGKDLIPVLGRTGKLQLVFSILLAIGLGIH
jgi:1,4-dihydroxy-2-naphthoate octaprenyltransferase